eukprot:TRINITY_DN5983_c0_g1_i2.p1 TRINITY_DN5983_c0_g1~~TRINITY_DN5983_c0_g1_i2.p1  ORF type:complete len:700 (-),score=164.18 TRINITY_DN5983_c0_g1_i2:31-2130(-)
MAPPGTWPEGRAQFLQDCRTAQRAIYELQSLTGRLARLVRRSGRKEAFRDIGDDAAECQRLGAEALTQSVRTNEAVAAVLQLLPADDQCSDATESRNASVMRRKLQNDLFVTMVCLRQSLQRARAATSVAAADRAAALVDAVASSDAAETELKRLCAQLRADAVDDSSCGALDEPAARGDVTAIAATTLSPEGGTVAAEPLVPADLPADCVLTHEAALRESGAANAELVVTLPAGTAITVVEVTREESISGRAQLRGRVREALGFSGFLTLRDVQLQIDFVRVLRRSAAGAAKAAVAEVTHQLVSQALTSVASGISEMNRVLLDPELPELSELGYVAGDYMLTRDAALTQGPLFRSGNVCVLPVGTCVSVEEVDVQLEECRIRGRVVLPSGQAGFVTLLARSRDPPGDCAFAKRIGVPGAAASALDSSGTVSAPSALSVGLGEVGGPAAAAAAAAAPLVTSGAALAAKAAAYAARKAAELADEGQSASLESAAAEAPSSASTVSSATGAAVDSAAVARKTAGRWASQALKFASTVLDKAPSPESLGRLSETDFPPGDYVLLRDAAVQAGLAPTGAQTSLLPAGSRFTLAEAICVRELQRVRGRIVEPVEGFLTLRFAEILFAKPAEGFFERSPDGPQPSSKKAMDPALAAAAAPVAASASVAAVTSVADSSAATTPCGLLEIGSSVPVPLLSNAPSPFV